MPRKKSTKPKLTVKVEGEDVGTIVTEPTGTVAVELQRNPNIVKNILKGTTLHLGDGRRLKFEEEAEVGPELAAFLRERGQAE